MKTLSSKKYLKPQKNISNAKQDKLSNHRQEHPTKKIQEFLQKSLYSNIQSQEYKISRWDTMGRSQLLNRSRVRPHSYQHQSND